WICMGTSFSQVWEGAGAGPAAPGRCYVADSTSATGLRGTAGAARAGRHSGCSRDGGRADALVGAAGVGAWALARRSRPLPEVRVMWRAAVRTASALCLPTAVAVLALGQAASGQGTPPGTAVRAKSLLGATVTLQGGTRAGTVEDIVLSNEGVVDYLLVSEG